MESVYTGTRRVRAKLRRRWKPPSSYSVAGGSSGIFGGVRGGALVTVTRSEFTLSGALLVALVLGGCPGPGFDSEEEQWSFEDHGLAVGGDTGLSNETPILVGSTICPNPNYQGEVSETTGDDDDSAVDDMVLLLECYEHVAEGPGSVVQDDTELCLLAEGPGEFTWHMEPVPCEANDVGYTPLADRVGFDLVAADDARASSHQWADEYAAEYLIPALAETFPDDLIHPDGDPYQVLAGAEVVVLAHLWDTTRDRALAWNVEAGGASVRTVRGSFEITEPVDNGWLGLKLEEGAEVVLELCVGEHTWDAATLIGVSEDALASIELVIAYGDAFLYPVAGVDQKYPQGARALFRDQEGRPVHGVPVEWEVHAGTLAVYPGPYTDYSSFPMLPGGDYAVLSDRCLPPWRSHGQRSARLEASYGDLSASRLLIWIASVAPGEDSAEGWERPQECLGRDCSCDATGGASRTSVLLPWMALMWVLRRGRGRAS